MPLAGAKFWLNVLTELKNRGLEEILIACVDGLSGFPEAIEVPEGLSKKLRFSSVSSTWCAIRCAMFRGKITRL